MQIAPDARQAALEPLAVLIQDPVDDVGISPGCQAFGDPLQGHADAAQPSDQPGLR